MTSDGKAPMCGWIDELACTACCEAGRTCYHDRVDKPECTCGRRAYTNPAYHLTPCAIRDAR